MPKSFFKGICKKKITFMVVPHSESRIFQCKIPLVVAVLLLVLSASIIIYSIVVIQINVDYRIAQQNAKEMKEKVSILNEEFAKVKERISKFSEQEKKVKEMLGYKDKNSLIEQKGFGGPSKNDMKSLENLLSSEIKKEDVKNTLSGVLSELDLREQSFKEVEKYLSGQRSVWAATPKGLPIKGYLTSKYGFRNKILDKMGSSDSGAKDWHAGIDVANRIGTKIKATADGKVVYAGRMGGYGLLVIVDHGYGFTTRYGHCKEILVKKGQEVKTGQELALIGMTGNTTGPHVHYEVRRYGKDVNPEKMDPKIYDRQ